MKRTSDLKLIVFFTALTFLLTVVVVLSWEKFLLPPFFAWVESKYPGPANAEARGLVQQRVEHFFISIAVDMVVVTLLLRVVRSQHRRVVESEERYRALFEHAFDGIAVVRAADFRLVEANGKFCETAGCRPEEVAGTDIRRLLRPESGDGQGESLARLLGGAEGEGEFVMEATPGAPTPVSASFSTLSAGGETWVMLIVRDLSARKHLEAEKEEMQRQLYQTSKLASLGELSAGVAHEINNPLNGIINFAQLLKDEPAARTEFESRMIDGIIDEGVRIAQIVRGLLSFARPDGSHGPARAHIPETVQTSVALFGHQLEKDGIHVRVEVEPNLPPVRADGSRLRQVVVNMISNAHQALRARGPDEQARVFRISARRAGREGAERVLLEFYDSGVGIRADDLDRVFDPFFTTRRDAGGTGLGLSISFAIVRDYGGTIRVESREGEFTCFTVELPAADSWEAEYA